MDELTLLSASQLAARLRVTPRTVLQWHREGRIPGIRISHKVLRFRLTDVVSHLEKNAERDGGEK